jgi:chlorite dismutase
MIHRGTIPSGAVRAAFVAGATGEWNVQSLEAIRGPPLAKARRLRVSLEPRIPSEHATWILRGVTSHERYATRVEHDRLAAVQPALDRPEATRAALIPIAKSADWWELPQDERRAIFEEESHHIAIGLEQLPAIARRLYHGRELGEPFDFLTWFEYAPEDAAGFEQLVERLRRTREWGYVEREIDIRLSRPDPSAKPSRLD